MDTLEFNGANYCYDIVREWNHLKVIEMDLPIKGCVCPWDESSGEYRIFINRNLSPREKTETFIHEMLHLWRGDFDKTDVQSIEYECHKESEELAKKIG